MPQDNIYYKDSIPMWEVIRRDPKVLRAMSRFNIPLGVGELTVREVCEKYGVDTDTFLAVATFIKFGEESAPLYQDRINLSSLMDYLTGAHDWFLAFQFPKLRRMLIEAVDCSERNETAFLILKFYDDYIASVRRHMVYENTHIFPYVHYLLSEGSNQPTHEIVPSEKDFETYLKGHNGMSDKLGELKNVLVKYGVAGAEVNLINDVVYDIYVSEEELNIHCSIENKLFIPAIAKMESKRNTHPISVDKHKAEADREQLTNREREVLKLAVKGYKNKEIAERLFISFNTVLTHRKNIARKLGIHSLSSLTIYAIASGLVSLKDISE